MIVIFNRLSVEEGAGGRVVERFASSRGCVQGFPSFVSMETLSSEGVDEVLVVAVAAQGRASEFRVLLTTEKRVAFDRLE